MRLTSEQNGLHRSLIDAMILSDGVLSSDPATLQHATNTTKAEWARCWPAVQRYWIVRGDQLFPSPEIATYVTPARAPSTPGLHRPSIPLQVIDAVFERHGKVCVYCGAERPIEIDHIVPYVRGGPSTVENLQPLCRPCNRRKGATVGRG